MPLLSAYERVLATHAPAIGAVESSVRTLTWLLPGRFNDSELAAEGVAALLALLGVYHDALVSPAIKHAVQQASVRPSPSPLSSSSAAAPGAGTAVEAEEREVLLATPTGYVPSLHTRYTLSQVRKPTYRRAGRLLQLITHIQLVLEMLAQRRARHTSSFPSTLVQPGAQSAAPTPKSPGQAGAIDLVVALEAFKLVLRLLIFWKSGWRPVLQDPLPERELDPADLVALPAPATQAQAQAQAPLQAQSWVEGGAGSMHLSVPGDTGRRKYRGTRTGQTYPCLGELGEGKVPDLDPIAPLSDDSEEETLVDPEEEASLARSRGWTSAQVDQFLLSRTLAPTDVRPLSDLMRPVQGPAGTVAEVLHLVRPLLYALLVRRYVQRSPQGSVSPWTPVGAAVVLDVMARALRRWSLDPRVPDPFIDPRGWARAVAPTNPLAGGGVQSLILRLVLATVMGVGGGAGDAQAPALSPLEADEFASRTAAWGWYLLRGPVWTEATRPRVQSLLGTLRSVPVLGLGAALAEDYLPLVDRYFYFTSR